MRTLVQTLLNTKLHGEYIISVLAILISRQVYTPDVRGYTLYVTVGTSLFDRQQVTKKPIIRFTVIFALLLPIVASGSGFLAVVALYKVGCPVPTCYLQWIYYHWYCSYLLNSKQ